jgi:substrate import-associated zinc metallohydrolase lipoprotein
MRHFKIFFYIISLASLVSCNKEDSLNPADVNQIPGLGGDSWVKGPIDTWIFDTLTVPFNISAKYKWDQSELAFNRTLVPPKEEKIIPVLSTIKKVWIDNYIIEGGELFMKQYSPKWFILVGSLSYDPDGTVTLGSAEGGRTILLYGLNDFRIKGMQGYTASDSFNVKQMFHTIEHEFGHILNQNIYYPQEFKLISVGDYTANWNNIPDFIANQDGFVTAYAMSAPDEDFVEMIAMMLIEGKAGFDRIVNSITEISPNGTSPEEAKSKLRAKEAIVVNYFADVWNINFYNLQARTRSSIEAIIK